MCDGRDEGIYWVLLPKELTDMGKHIRETKRPLFLQRFEKGEASSDGEIRRLYKY